MTVENFNKFNLGVGLLKHYFKDVRLSYDNSNLLHVSSVRGHLSPQWLALVLKDLGWSISNLTYTWCYRDAGVAQR